jgi:glycosyltransferase involved in cell wall biosynthesis
MAERVNTLLSDHELRQQMGRAAIQHVHACFDMKKQVTETEQLYLSVLKHKSA